MSLITTLQVSMTTRYSWAADLIASGISIQPTLSPGTLTLASGVASGQADEVVLDQIVLAPSASVSLVLDDDSLRNPKGDPISFASLKAIYLAVAAGADGVTMGNGGAGSFTGWLGTTTSRIFVPLGVALPLWHPTTGYAVGAAEFIKLTAGASGATVNLGLVGVAA